MDLLNKKKSKGIYFLSFLLPFLLSTLAFALAEVAPFGEYSLLRSDAHAQYHPFLSLYRDILLQGGSLEHTWSVGMGINFLPMLSYYLSSPLYLLVVLVPEAYLCHFMLLLTVLKLGLAGLFFAKFLTYAYNSRDKLIPFFALLYALCAWAAGYYWNIIWLDVFALLPLLITGTLAMLRESRFRLYVLALALSFWCNYYLSFCVCVFVLLCYVGYRICNPTGWKNFLRSFLRFGLCTLLAFAMASVLILPTLLGMQNTNSAKVAEFDWYALRLPESFYGFSLSAMVKALAQVFSRTLTLSDPTFMEGLPNLFCGYSVLILGFTFLWNRAFSRRDRIFHGGLLLFFIFSCIFKLPDYIWHGFHFPNMIPNRFSFLFSFTLVTMAFRGYGMLHVLSLKRLLLSLGCGFTMILCALLYKNEVSFGYYTLVVNLCVFTAMCVILLLGSGVSLPRLFPSLRKRLVAVALALLFLGEGFFSIYTGVDGGTDLKSTVGHVVTGQTLYETATASDSELFYRAEFSHEGISNDGAAHHYNGIDVFSSSALVSLGHFASALGIRAWPESNSSGYWESTPFTNTLCGVKYILAKEDGIMDETLPLAGRLDGYEIRSVPSYIGMGFMTNSELASFASVASNKNPYDEQNQLFRLATGSEEDLYRYINDPELEASEGCTIEKAELPGQYLYTVPDEQSRGTFTLRYTMEEVGLLSVSTRMPGGKNVVVSLNGQQLFECTVHSRGIYSLGRVVPGDVIELVYTSDAYKSAGISIFMTLQNDDVLQQGLATLSDETWNITYADDTTLEGTVTALKDGLFYTSIPYEPGWTVKVDGIEIPVATGYDPQNTDVKLTDALIAFPLSAGDHDISMTYRTPGLGLGLGLSLGALTVFLILILCKKETLFPNLIPTEKENSNES